MTLNFEKIKSDAEQSIKESQTAIDKDQKIIAAVIQHKDALRELFRSLFKEQNTELKGVGMQLIMPFGGGIQVSLYIPEVTKLENRIMGKLDKEANPVFIKQKNDEIISSASFVDATDYLGPSEQNIEYQYTYKVGTETHIVKFDELKQYIQYVIDA